MESEKKGLLFSLGSFWKNIFNYKGVTEVREYIILVIFYAAISIVDMLIYFFAYLSYNTVLRVIFVILTIYIFVSIVPCISLTVRRLRANNKNVWWTLLLGVFGIGLLVLIGMCVRVGAQDGFNPFYNEAVCVYGPPPFDPDNNYNVDVYGPPVEDFDEEDNVPETVYGPPSDFEDEVEDETEDETKDSKDEAQSPDNYSSENNINPEVYGPPTE